MRSAEVAVVIPCYNDRQFLPEAIASARAQEPDEIIVVDDGSTDLGTVELLDRLGAEGVRVIRQPNSGPSAARMTGVRATQAEYVLPLDSDDLLAPGTLTDLRMALDADPRLVVAWGNVELFMEDGRRLHARAPDRLDPWLTSYVNQYPLSALFRRDALLEAGGYALREGYEDWDLWMALAERGRPGIRVDRLTERHRVHGSRRWSQDFARHERSLMVLRQRHPLLFSERRANRRRSSAPRRLKLLLPLIEAAPFVSATTVYRLEHLASHPLLLSGWVLRGRLQALRAS
jgi:glycosyltransferase involved in cell wall biosynthesis